MHDGHHSEKHHRTEEGGTSNNNQTYGYLSIENKIVIFTVRQPSKGDIIEIKPCVCMSCSLNVHQRQTQSVITRKREIERERVSTNFA